MNLRKLPIGIQSFEKIRTEGYVYVDKTAYVYRLATEGNPYFLGRPRRFGKSLLLSTLKAYFLGQRELFEGCGGQEKLAGQVPLAIAELEQDWIPHPVFHIDMNVENYTGGLRALESGLDANLYPLEEQWGRNQADTSLSTRFLSLIRRACEKSGRKVAVLIDEYDKPLLETMDNPDLNAQVRKNLKAFYGILKTADPWLRFVFLTGVTKFSQVSVFSDLNQLRDISMDEAYAGICGISAGELTGNFEPELRALAEKNGVSYDEALNRMRKRYDGYHFTRESGGRRAVGAESSGLFNPFSVLSTFARGEFDYYWFQTGTPTFLVNQLKKTDFDLRKLSEGVRIRSQAISNYRLDGGDPTPILYQSGYLTIRDYDKQFDIYTLGFPNEEVEYGFLEALLPAYMPRPGDWQGFFVGNFVEDLQKGDVEGFMTRLRAFFADIPYELNDKTERHYQTLIYLVFRLMGQYAAVEFHSAKGRADLVVFTADTVYVFEFKLTGGGTAEDALAQIDGQGYLIPYTAGKRKLVKIGVDFDPEERNIGRWMLR
jgi:hypothetical protein